MKTLIIGLLFLSFTNLGYTQDSYNEIAALELEEIIISPPNFIYLNQVQDKYTPKLVKKLEYIASKYDIKESEIYDPNEEKFAIVFKQKNGRIIAIFDNSGKIVTCYEKYHNVKLPPKIRKNIFIDNPGWLIHSDTYLVSYRYGSEVKKTYKIQLRKGNLKKNLKLDSEGGHLKLASVD